MVKIVMHTWIALILLEDGEGRGAPMQLKIKAETMEQAVAAIHDYDWGELNKVAKSIAVVQVQTLEEMRSIVVKQRRRRRRGKV